MKLTTARLKKLIREEMQKLNEAIPARFTKKGVITYNNDKLMYYIFEKVVKFITTVTKTKQKHPTNNKIRHTN